MKTLLSVAVLSLAALVPGKAQKKPQSAGEIIRKEEIEAHLSFLAADEMRGRNAGSPELDIAANYIRTMYRIHGLKAVAGTDDFFQPVEMLQNLPPDRADATVGNMSFVMNANLLVMAGDAVEWKGEMVYIGYGSGTDIEKFDLSGKMVLALAGSREADNLNKVFTASNQKLDAIRDAGGAGLIEILALPQAPWPALVNFLSQPRWGIQTGKSTIPHAWVRPSDLGALQFREGEMVSGSFSTDGRKRIPVAGKNVAGLIEGTDAALRDEFIVLTAHYDHIGVLRNGDQDSIFNGARDNAIGTVALIQAAKYLSRNPPKRSVIFLALTSEEKGLLGSQWYTEHPLVPLNQTVLNINCDGVGYNDKSIITSISLARTTTDETIRKAAKAFGLGVGGDPDPSENFFERSDQVSFARKGVVAIKLQPGLAGMDDEIRKYYHRQADEVSSLDFDYLEKFYGAYVYAVQLLANEPKRPAWRAGDKFEPASKELYSTR